MRETLTQRQLELHNLLVNDLPFYCENVLSVQTKDPKNPMTPLKLNRAQLYIHQEVEDQLRRTGKVRKIIIKGRQQGASTYITARFYHKAVMRKNLNVYILSHESISTGILFDKVYTYYEEAEQVIKPALEEDNQKTLGLSNGSKYTVGTANAKGTGRSGTNHLFHGSEPAHYEDGANVQAGALQTVPSADDTEIFLETTANGMNWFYHFTQDARAGLGEYEVIFVPWYWSDEYIARLKPGFQLTETEARLKEIYDLSDEQIQWRRNKIVELKNDKERTGNPERLFKQEYPFTIDEAFQASGEPFFDPDTVQAARNSTIEDYDSPVIIGVDPARNRDRTTIVVRQGRVIRDLKIKRNVDTGEMVGTLINLIKEEGADKIFIDKGFGYGIIDGLRDLGYGAIVQGISFSEGPSRETFLNKRAEMYHELRDWLDDGPVRIPDSDEVAADLACIPQPKVNNIGRISFIDKEQIKKIYGKSPDIADAMILTFAYPVRRKDGTFETRKFNQKRNSSIFQTKRNVQQITRPEPEYDGMTDGTRAARSKDWRKSRQWGF